MADTVDEINLYRVIRGCSRYYFWLHGSLKAVIALPLGHLLACFSDTFTKQGVQLFYPEPVWAISVSNPRRRLKTGGAGELWVLGGAIALLRDQYALGTVEVRIVRSPPSY